MFLGVSSSETEDMRSVGGSREGQEVEGEKSKVEARKQSDVWTSDFEERKYWQRVWMVVEI